jgi:hypothetical protein
MRRWFTRGWLILTGVTLLMLIPGVALADNCAGGGLSDCADSAAAAAKIAAGVGVAAAGGILLAGGSSSGNGNGSGGGSGTGGGDAAQPGEDISRGTHQGANPPEPTVSDQIWKEIKDFYRAQEEGLKDFRKDVEDVGKDMRHELAKEIAEDFNEDPTDRYKDN